MCTSKITQLYYIDLKNSNLISFTLQSIRKIALNIIYSFNSIVNQESGTTSKFVYYLCHTIVYTLPAKHYREYNVNRLRRWI